MRVYDTRRRGFCEVRETTASPSGLGSKTESANPRSAAHCDRSLRAIRRIDDRIEARSGDATLPNTPIIMPKPPAIFRGCFRVFPAECKHRALLTRDPHPGAPKFMHR
ncbi:hypothetical protein KM043_009920 [Ampulex compressa]|nr:hypothetical protein KM043_009920 [Ampulex compressa]